MPKRGERWRRRDGSKTETRNVIDETLGGDVCYTTGRIGRGTYNFRHFYSPGERRCTLAEWTAWVSKAKRVD